MQFINILKRKIQSYNKHPLIQKIGLKTAICIFILGVMCSLVLTLILMGIQHFFAETAFMKEYNTLLGTYEGIKTDFITAVIKIAIISPLLEEYLCRRLFCEILDRLFKLRVFTIIGSTMLFSTLHAGVVQRTYALIFGFILCLLYLYEPVDILNLRKQSFKLKYETIINGEKTNILRPYIFHMAFNLTGVLLAII